MKRILCVSMDASSSQVVLDISKNFTPLVLPCAGLHPVVFARADVDKRERLLQEILAFIDLHHAELVGIGEIGLDFSPWILSAQGEDVADAKQAQMHAFSLQMKAARRYGLPVNVHSRGAGHYAIEMVVEHKVQALMHAFDGRLKYAMDGARRGLYFSIAPSVARDVQLQKLAAALPADSIVLETDAPALAPVRNEVCVPADLQTALATVALARGVGCDKLVTLTAANAVRLFPRAAPDKDFDNSSTNRSFSTSCSGNNINNAIVVVGNDVRDATGLDFKCHCKS